MLKRLPGSVVNLHCFSGRDANPLRLFVMRTLFGSYHPQGGRIGTSGNLCPDRACQTLEVQSIVYETSHIGAAQLTLAAINLTGHHRDLLAPGMRRIGSHDNRYLSPLGVDLAAGHLDTRPMVRGQMNSTPPSDCPGTPKVYFAKTSKLAMHYPRRPSCQHCLEQNELQPASREC